MKVKYDQEVDVLSIEFSNAVGGNKGVGSICLIPARQDIGRRFLLVGGGIGSMFGAGRDGWRDT